MAKIVDVNNKDGSFYRHIFYCPGCKCNHGVHNGWEFNGDYEKPTFTSSVLVNGVSEYIDPSSPRCHLYVTDGKI